MRRLALFALLLLLGAPAAAQPAITQLIVKLKPAAEKAAVSPHVAVRRVAEDAGVDARPLRTLATGAVVLALDKAVDAGAAKALAARLAAHPLVQYAEPDRRVHPARVANDPQMPAETYLYADLAGISALPAWDITTGSPSVVVAIVDTGYRPHEDLVGRLLPGYDMVSDPATANDGDGRDPDASDPGDGIPAGSDTADCPVSVSSWHGTGVAGIVAADASNLKDLTGIDWYARILPVRVLGRCGGDMVDVIEGIAWAAGLAVSGVPPNPNPAQVINVSLGGEGTCDPATADIIAAAYAHGVTRAVVAAAGNDGTDVANHVPASCPGVISVASTTSSGNLARYSNFGATVTLSAPGGDFSRDGSAVLLPVLSNSGLYGPGADSTWYEGGTSLAAPMVSGTVALMLSVAPDLTSDQVRSILVSSAKPFPAPSTCSTANCGAGIVNALNAVQAAAAVAPARATLPVAEYYNASLDHYFITWGDAEQRNLDEGKTPTRWVRTGYAFNTWSGAPTAASPVCRYYIPPALGDSHFFGRGTAECDQTGQKNPSFVLEDPAFMHLVLPAAGACPVGTTPIYRVFSNRADANHRYMTDPSVRDQMVAEGWVAEGDGPDRVVMCAPH
ncbi:MAG TPA: S8 family peptidase [Casimicrobiaceae bacterium]|jgi:serine protease